MGLLLICYSPCFFLLFVYNQEQVSNRLNNDAKVYHRRLEATRLVCLLIWVAYIVCIPMKIVVGNFTYVFGVCLYTLCSNIWPSC